MNTRIIKIVVIVSVVVGFVVYSILNLHSIDNMNFLKIEPFNFSTYIDQQTSEDIVGQARQSAQKAYLQLYREVSTEATLNHTTSSNPSPTPLLSQSDAKECYETLFTAYFPIFQQWTDAVFKSSNWNSGDLNQIKSEADSLKNRQGVSLIAKDSLEKYSSYVDGYKKAYGLLFTPCNCKVTYDDLCRKAKSYCVYPYHNNSFFGHDFANKVAKAARKKWHDSIKDAIRNFANRDKEYYRSMEVLDADYRALDSRISEYGSSDLANEIETLKNAYDKFKEVISQRQKTTNNIMY